MVQQLLLLLPSVRGRGRRGGLRVLELAHGHVEFLLVERELSRVGGGVVGRGVALGLGAARLRRSDGGERRGGRASGGEGLGPDLVLVAETRLVGAGGRRELRGGRDRRELTRGREHVGHLPRGLPTLALEELDHLVLEEHGERVGVGLVALHLEGPLEDLAPHVDRVLLVVREALVERVVGDELEVAVLSAAVLDAEGEAHGGLAARDGAGLGAALDHDRVADRVQVAEAQRIARVHGEVADEHPPPHVGEHEVAEAVGVLGRGGDAVRVEREERVLTEEAGGLRGGELALQAVDELRELAVVVDRSAQGEVEVGQRVVGLVTAVGDGQLVPLLDEVGGEARLRGRDDLDLGDDGQAAVLVQGEGGEVEGLGPARVLLAHVMHSLSLRSGSTRIRVIAHDVSPAAFKENKGLFSLKAAGKPCNTLCGRNRNCRKNRSL